MKPQKTQEIKTEINLTFWIWSATDGINRFNNKWRGYVKDLTTSWSILNPLKLKVKVLIAHETETEHIHANS